jgi:hypothetical protein
MAISDSILLQIGQKQTAYNDLLTKMLPSYSSVNSAKAALSRALKDLVAFGEIKKEEDFYFLTDKGKQIVESKLKNKILININELLKKSQGHELQYIDDIIKNLQVFIERSKTDQTLLKIGKTGASFYISDLEQVKNAIADKISHFTNMSQVFERQILALQELNFEDIVSINIDDDVFDYVKKFCEQYNLSEITVDCDKNDVITNNLFKDNNMFSQKIESFFILKVSNIEALKKVVLTSFETAMRINFKIYLNEILVVCNLGKVNFMGSYRLINELRNEIKKREEEEKEKNED